MRSLLEAERKVNLGEASAEPHMRCYMMYTFPFVLRYRTAFSKWPNLIFPFGGGQEGVRG